jgi:hypothetical protein
MGPTDAELQRRQAELRIRERCVAARESELHARRSWRRLWWALRLAPWGIVELVVASWCIAAGAVLGGAALRVSCILTGVVIAAVACARLSGATTPPNDRSAR